MQSDSHRDAALGENSAQLASLDFYRIYAETSEFVERAARRLGVADNDVEDVAQDVFVHIHRHLPNFEGRSTLKTWVFGFVVSAVRNYRRKKRRRSDRDAQFELSFQSTHCPPMCDPYELTACAQAESILKRVAQEIGEDKAAVLVLSEFEERTMLEISTLLGVNVNTLYSPRRTVRAEFDEALARLLASKITK